jgi:acyl CoA:acetate/3-ketoacid CoA transferase alpha subunit/acyl CoA:acetate/3-ketoacid CoA transferase beta subunit
LSPARLSLGEAVERHVRPGDVLHVLCGHCRWTAAAREVVRQFWGTDPGFTLVMVSLGSLGALFFEGGLLRKVVTSYSGDSFPTYTPNPVFQRGYASGVEVEHWSILTFAQRLEAAARGLPALVTGSLQGSAMAANEAFATVASPFASGGGGRAPEGAGPAPIGLVAPLVPDVALVHGALADRHGNVALSEPLLEGVWGAWAARRGVVATVEKVVDDLDRLGPRVRIPAHRVLAVVETPFGAHPGGLFAPGLPVEGYGEDIPFWVEARQATRSDFASWARHWVLEPASHEEYLARLGPERLGWLRRRSDPASWQEDAAAHPVDEAAPPSAWEQAAALAGRELRRLIDERRAHAVLAGAGVANLAAWAAVDRARREGSDVQLTAELGMLGYRPTPADPYIFNHRTFPSTPLLADASTVLGMVVGGPGTRTVACLGAAQVDRRGNLNSTTLGAGGGPFLVGSGGANDVASRAEACVVVTLARPDRLVDEVAYVTSPGERVVAVATERGVLRRRGGELVVEAVAAGPEPLAQRVRAFARCCGWEPAVAPRVEELAAPAGDEVLALRRYDPERLFLA